MTNFHLADVTPDAKYFDGEGRVHEVHTGILDFQRRGMNFVYRKSRFFGVFRDLIRRQRENMPDISSIILFTDCPTVRVFRDAFDMFAVTPVYRLIDLDSNTQYDVAAG